MNPGSTYTDMRILIEHLTPANAKFVLTKLKGRPASMNPILWDKLTTKAETPDPEPQKPKEASAVWDRYDYSDAAYRNDWKAFQASELSADDLAKKWRGRAPDRSIIADLMAPAGPPAALEARRPDAETPAGEPVAAPKEDGEEPCFG